MLKEADCFTTIGFFRVLSDRYDDVRFTQERDGRQSDVQPKRLYWGKGESLASWGGQRRYSFSRAGIQSGAAGQIPGSIAFFYSKL